MAQMVVVDDDVSITQLLRLFFEDRGHQVSCCESFQQALTALEDQHDQLDLIISDMQLPDGTGLDLIHHLKARKSDVPLILITAHGNSDTAANALKSGVFDYITKPLNLTELEVICDRALKLKALERHVHAARRFYGLVGNCRKMQQLFQLIAKISATNSNVLVTGESGTGKELVARALHEIGPRRSKNFVAVNCSAIPSELLEAELFGFKKGSFTGAHEDRKGLFEEADGGTLFLDEIGDMPPLLQAKLLRVLQDRQIKRVGENRERKVDVRIVAATHRELKEAIQTGHFREDLYFRLCVIPVHLPPLRERQEDIPLLATHFLRQYAVLNNRSISGFTREAMACLLNCPWPGNVRELENTVERAVALCSSTWIDEADLCIEGQITEQASYQRLFSKTLTLRELEKEYIRHVLVTTGGKKEEVAAILGIDRKTLYRKEREYNLKN